jgi:hypothetical protein
MIAVADALATAHWRQGMIDVSKSAPVGAGHPLVSARDIQATLLSNGPRAAFEREVSGRRHANFLCSASAAPGLIKEMWAFAKSAYIDSPLPSLFKERLFVHLSRFCEVRYCIIRHIGFLIGEGRPAGDPEVRRETIEQVTTLLQRPMQDAKVLAAKRPRATQCEIRETIAACAMCCSRFSLCPGGSAKRLSAPAPVGRCR